MSPDPLAPSAIPSSDQLTISQAIASAIAAKNAAQLALADIPAATDAEVGPALAPYIAQAESARDAAVVAKTVAENARDNALATERRMRQQSLGEFADDAAAEAWAAAQSPAITIITGTSYLNTTTDIFRYAVVSAGPTIVWHDVTEDEAAQAVLAQASATAAAASLSTMLTKLVGAFSTDPTYVGGSPPWVVGALYFNTLSNKLKVWTSGNVWAFYDAAAQTASTSAAYNATVSTATLTLFQSYFCGASATDPTVDGAGNALTTAAFYFNTVSGKLRTHVTGAWADYDASAQAAASTATTKAGDAAAAAIAAAASAAILTYRGFVNRLRNADFRINQRAVSGTVMLAAGAYGHDGYKAGTDGCTYTFAQSGMVVTLNISTGSLLQPIEAGLIEGGYYRLSHQGTAQARVWQGSTPPAGGYAAAPFTTANLTAVTRTNVEFSTGTVLLPQLERGTSETAFERRPHWAELAFCQRYYLRRASAGTTDIICMVSAYNGAGVWGKLFDLPVEMRADGGTVGFSSAGHLAVFNASGGASYAGSSVSGGLASKRSVALWGGLSCSGSPGFTAGQALFLIFNNAAGWIDVSVEI